jgi:hypothetical protein
MVQSFYQSPFQVIKRPDRTVQSRIFGTRLQSCNAGLYSPVFSNGLQKRPRSRPDQTVASLKIAGKGKVTYTAFTI